MYKQISHSYTKKCSARLPNDTHSWQPQNSVGNWKIRDFHTIDNIQRKADTTETNKDRSSLREPVIQRAIAQESDGTPVLNSVSLSSNTHRLPQKVYWIKANHAFLANDQNECVEIAKRYGVGAFPLLGEGNSPDGQSHYWLYGLQNDERTLKYQIKGYIIAHSHDAMSGGIIERTNCTLQSNERDITFDMNDGVSPEKSNDPVKKTITLKNHTKSDPINLPNTIPNLIHYHCGYYDYLASFQDEFNSSPYSYQGRASWSFGLHTDRIDDAIKLIDTTCHGETGHHIINKNDLHN